ncbi:signal peptidase II [Solicola sp. PLA-1-18]|uniref:signal peptidase II n=1 Tax=Solicola sp. PLA-1-18 TaxID=3380532 RepID=UPI003B76A299
MSDPRADLHTPRDFDHDHTATRRGVTVMVAAVGLTTLALVFNVVVEQLLSGTASIDLGPLELRLGYNPGIAFGMGSHLPRGVITLATGAITVAIGVYAVWSTPQNGAIARTGFTALIAGAAANVLDRAGDGVVTDYFHTGWFATFNLADVLITGAVILIVADSLLAGRRQGRT